MVALRDLSAGGRTIRRAAHDQPRRTGSRGSPLQALRSLQPHGLRGWTKDPRRSLHGRGVGPGGFPEGVAFVWHLRCCARELLDLALQGHAQRRPGSLPQACPQSPPGIRWGSLRRQCKGSVRRTSAGCGRILAVVARVQSTRGARCAAPRGDRAGLFLWPLSKRDIRADWCAPRHRQEPDGERLQELAQGACGPGRLAGGHKMTCAEVHSNLATFVLGGLEPEEAAEIQRHIASCADCQSELEELWSVNRALDAAPPPAAPPAYLKGEDRKSTRLNS